MNEYLGGNLINGNLPNDPQSPWYWDHPNSESPGIDMTEFIDGMLCRGWHTPMEVVPLVVDVMGFTSYDPNLAPEACP